MDHGPQLEAGQSSQLLVDADSYRQLQGEDGPQPRACLEHLACHPR